MIELIFDRAGQKIGIQINGELIVFYDFSSLMQAHIDGLKLSYAGVIKEFPDLKENPDWNKIAIQRFKEHIKSLPNEEKRCEYIIDDLKKWGWKPLYKRRQGFRPIKIS